MPLSVELIDPTLAHQIVLEHDGNERSKVTCNCWPVLARNQRHFMGSATDIPGCWAIYNDPAKHRTPFGDEWRRPRSAWQ